MSARRGFTLIEVLVALTIGAVILTSAVAVFAYAVGHARVAYAKAELERDGSFLQETLERELRVAGAGMPRGAHQVDGYAGAGVTQFYAPVLVAAATEVGVVADLPRADADYSAYGLLSTQADGGADFGARDRHLFWFTENNGMCQPDGSDGAAPACTTGQTSTFFPGLNGCNSDANPTDRTCPWGLRRMVGGEVFQVVLGDGGWQTTKMESPIELHGAVLNHALRWTFVNRPLVNWDAETGAPLPSGAPGQSFVTTLDRVFFRLQGTTVERIQCRGDPDPSDVDFPNAAATAVPGSPQNVNPATGEPNVCTPFEPIARNVQSVAFRYFDAAGAAVPSPINTAARKDSIAAIEYDIVLQKNVGIANQVARHELSGRIALRNNL